MNIKKIILLAAMLIAPIEAYSAPTLQDYMRIYHSRMNTQIRNETIIFGDSISQSFDVSQFIEKTSNFAVGGSTSTQLIQKINETTNICRAGRVQLMIGINDINKNEWRKLVLNLSTIAEKLDCAKTTWVGILHPTSPKFSKKRHEMITSANWRIKETCEAMRDCTYVPPPLMKAEWYYDDGVHPNHLGYRVLNWQINIK